jgi:hypothetical protein
MTHVKVDEVDPGAAFGRERYHDHSPFSSISMYLRYLRRMHKHEMAITLVQHLRCLTRINTNSHSPVYYKTFPILTLSIRLQGRVIMSVRNCEVRWRGPLLVACGMAYSGVVHLRHSIRPFARACMSWITMGDCSRLRGCAEAVSSLRCSS